MVQRVVTVNDVLAGHAALDIECLDRVYLNAYGPILQSSGQVAAFMTQYLDLPIPSPTLFEKIGQRFRRAMAGDGLLRRGERQLGGIPQRPRQVMSSKKSP